MKSMKILFTICLVTLFLILSGCEEKKTGSEPNKSSATQGTNQKSQTRETASGMNEQM
jgi:PBP1b-binding outer membrane lipoprotein LpoB